MSNSHDSPTDAQQFGQFVFGAFIVGTLSWLVALIGNLALAQSGWFQGIFLVVALTATLLALNRALPAQNAFAAAAIIAVLSAFAVSIGVKTGIPFGLVFYSDNSGPQIFGVLPWPVPLIWVLAILNSRGVARLILRPWRKVSRYGYWIFALTVALAVLFDFNLEPFATGVAQWWLWRAPDASAWYTAPWTNFLGWFATTIITLGFMTPWIIMKRPGNYSTPDYQPLALWLAMNLIPAIGCATHYLWWAAGLGSLSCAAVAYFAVEGGKW
jgi:uncharacterized membrane protein